MMEKLYKYRFEFFLITQLSILFGSLFFPKNFYDHTLLPILYLVSILSGILVISKTKKLMWIVVVLFSVAVFLFGANMVSRSENTENTLIRLSIYFIFYIVVTWHIIQQVWKTKRVTKNVIIGLMSGYISLGFLGFFLFMSIEIIHPGAFTGLLLESTNFRVHSDSILYYAYITLLTIGYGEIVPTIPIAQKATIFVGLIGQFYLVIITAVVVGKYIKHASKD